jgi:hypothetical protein
MGWKSTLDISRTKAKRLIIERMMNIDDLTNAELGDMIEGLGYGENPNLKYYGHNFTVFDDNMSFPDDDDLFENF